MPLSISIPMPPRLTHYMLCAALESSCGSHYWAANYAVREQTNESGEYVAVHLGRSTDINDAKVKHSRIGASRIAAALSLMLSLEEHAERAGRVIGGNFYASDADVVLQFAAFGEVIYG